MAYFDSSKNRALWEIRLGQLRRERQLREQGGTGDAFAEEAGKEMVSRTRVPVSYQELLKEEAMASEKQKGRERGAREMDREKAMAQNREKEEIRHEMG